MDSANSGSMQSSSTAGDVDYDSRADPSSSSISAFLNHPTPQPTTHVFDPLSSYLDDPTPRSQPHPNSNQILNLDMVWSKRARSQPDLASFVPCSSPSSPHNNQPFLFGAGQSQTRGGVNVGALFPPPQSAASPSPRGGLPVSIEQNSSNINTNTVRNPKKRSRASRRAPTTVLTTDTTNFRAMVQEFTGIPAPPFTSSSFPRTRLDLFASSNASSAIRSASTSTHLEHPTPTLTTPYLLRPSAHKVQASIPTSSSFPPLASNNSSTSINYHHHSLNMHNPILTLQSILQPPPLGNNNSSVPVASKTQQPSLEIPPTAVDSSHLKMGGLQELGLRHAHVAAHHQNINIVSSSSDGALSRAHNNMRGPSSVEWAQAQTIGSNGGGVLRSLTGATLNYRSNVSDHRGKVYFSGTNSDFHGDKLPECAVAARTEGMLESWINCSSD